MNESIGDSDERPGSSGLPIDIDRSGKNNETAKSTQYRLKPGRKREHPVHDYFEQLNEKNFCKVWIGGKQCGQLIRSSNPTNLKKHLSLHIDAYNDYLQKETDWNASKILLKDSSPFKRFKGAEKGPLPYPRGHPKQRELDDALADFVLSTSVPYRIVLEPSFRKLLNVADKRYEMPWRKRLGKISLHRYQLLQAELLERLDKAKRISICVDIWSKQSFTKSYMGITAHFFDFKSHRPIRVLLGLRPMLEGHGAIYVRKIVYEVLTDWNLDSPKLFKIQSDNGSNVVSAFRNDSEKHYRNANNIEGIESDASEAELGENSVETLKTLGFADFGLEEELEEEIVESELESVEEVEAEINEFERLEQEYVDAFGHFIHLRCIAHSLQCSLRSIVDRNPEFRDIKMKVLKLQNSVHHSAVAQQMLSEKTEMRLVSISNTRWNIIFDVFDRILLLKAVINDVCENQGFDSLSNTDWAKVNKKIFLIFLCFPDNIEFLIGLFCDFV